jgi:hypothetical protein
MLASIACDSIPGLPLVRQFNLLLKQYSTMPVRGAAVVKALPRPCSMFLALRTKGIFFFSIFISSERTGLWKRAFNRNSTLKAYTYS